jgi:hypothetical protein
VEHPHLVVHLPGRLEGATGVGGDKRLGDRGRVVGGSQDHGAFDHHRPDVSVGIHLAHLHPHLIGLGIEAARDNLQDGRRAFVDLQPAVGADIGHACQQ